MKICFLDNVKILYTSKDIYTNKIRGAENVIINLSKSLSKLNDFISTKEAVFYNNIDDLIKKINIYKKNDRKRIRIARAVRNMYHKYFNFTLVVDYIVKKTLNVKYQKKFYWER